MKNVLIIVCSFVLVLSSCKKKEYPSTVTGNPEFYVKANIDGQPIMLQAGTLDYYMYSNYEQNADGIYTFIADVKPKNCGNACPNSLKIEVYDDQMVSQGGASNISSSVKTGTYQFVNSNTVNPTIVGYAVSYKSSFNLSASSYSWNFGYGAPSYSALPTHTYVTPGVYNTRFAVFDGANWSSIENPVKVTDAPNVCKARVVLQSVVGNQVTFNRILSGSGPYSYRWDFGDGTIPSIDATPTHTYDSPGLYKVNLTVIDAGNTDTAYHNYYVNTNLSQQPAPNFYPDKVTPILSNSPLAKIKITYTDGSGKVYTSSMEPQTGNTTNFQIVSVEDYRTNENSQATKKLKITFNCKLFNGSSTLDISGGEAVIAVAYK